MRRMMILAAAIGLAGCTNYADSPLGPNYVQPSFNSTYVQTMSLTDNRPCAKPEHAATRAEAQPHCTAKPAP